jgi:two-component system response regulator
MTATEIKRILLVDDDSAGAELTVAALAEFDLGVEIDITSDGEEALDYLFRRGHHAQRPDHLPALILLDLKMPKIDGHEVLRQIRGHEHLRHLPVIILTSSDQESDRRKSEALGSDGYLVKPVSIDHFIDDLRRLKKFWTVLERTPPL